MSLNINELKNGFTYIKIGELTEDITNILKLNHSKCDIIMWEDKFQYIRKHIKDFKSEEIFEKCVSQIPEIITNPDYIGIHPTKNSIEYIKRIETLVIIAIRIKNGKLALKTMFPLTENQLQDYINSGTVKKIVNNS